VNIGSRVANFDYVLHLNNDVIPLESGWLNQMMGWMQFDDVAVVGSLLLHPDNKIQHMGVTIGNNNGLADHKFYGSKYMTINNSITSYAASDVSAVTGACFLTKKEFFQNDGFDEVNFKVQFNDVDFCIRKGREGYRIIFDPNSVLIHKESTTRKNNYDFTEHINFINKYNNYKDKFINENLSLSDTSLSINKLNYVYKDINTIKSITLFSHNLNIGGAQTVLYDFCRFGVQNDIILNVISPSDGKMRELLEFNGVNVLVVKPQYLSIFSATDSELNFYINQLCNLDIVIDSDILIANTLESFWVSEIAKQKNKFCEINIHESVTINNFKSRLSSNLAQRLFVASMNDFNLYVFQSKVTRSIYIQLDDDKVEIINGGVDISGINTYLKNANKIEMRHLFNIRNDEIVVSIIGTTCERKGQLDFLKAIALFQQSEKNSSLMIRFHIVGISDSNYSQVLKHYVADHNLKNIYFYEETLDIYPHYLISDLFCCTSLQESFPIVLLLAMAFDLPIITTPVFGISEIFQDYETARFFSVGDYKYLANLISDYIVKADQYKLMAIKSKSEVIRKYDISKLAKIHFVTTKRYFCNRLLS
jgi:glycosyltransferase involved in cell wall biosynthesis